ncbi:elongation factor G-binding protein [Halobacillus halophilus]|uniref:FusB/FusC family EF-G-binding protein n=1 Tax=Halobacillus halophilus TaxID=1570 RepID=UPI0013687B5F|nr:FusB/FusC family EF-G-binding protein [Halobacillus halophilus]MYL28717.1 elongation factor G-binding protein [Halobacillus halophilus]
MDAFIRSDQYHFIQNETQNLLNGHRTTTDSSVTQALTSLSSEKALDVFDTLTKEQSALIRQIEHVQEETDAIFYFSRLKHYVIPFPKLTDAEIQLLFPKVKKLQVPEFDEADWSEMSYMGWNDPAANRKYLITKVEGRYTGLYGHFLPSRQNNICTICHEQEQVGLFTVTGPGKGSGESVSRGNYICYDSRKCNENIKSRKPLETFIRRMMNQ